MLKQLVLQAKREYEAEAVHRIQIYFADTYGSWRWTDSRHKRPMSSIVLNAGVKEMLIADTKDFLRSEKVSASCPKRLHLCPQQPCKFRYTPTSCPSHTLRAYGAHLPRSVVLGRDFSDLYEQSLVY